jgi:hypothetical protein
VYYIVKDRPVKGKRQRLLFGQEQGLRARIMKLAYIRDVGIGTVCLYTVPIMLIILSGLSHCI